jgi:hypothetical protein
LRAAAAAAVLLAIVCLIRYSRSFINDTPVAFDPERAMAELVLHTHYLPRHWRGRAHSAEVQQALNSMFSFKLLLFLEELASVLLTPFILAYSLPRCAGEWLLRWQREGVGLFVWNWLVCWLACC